MGASHNCPGIEMFNTSEAWNGAEARDTRGIRRVGVGARQAGGDRPRNEVSQQLGWAAQEGVKGVDSVGWSC